MLRTSASRLLASTSQRAFAARPISSSAPALIRVKKPEGAAPPSNSTPPNPPPASTPPPPPPAAEEPAKKAADVATPPPAEPAPSPAADGAAADSATKATEPEAAEDVIPDKPDLSKLPSLDIDPEVQPVIEEPKPKGGKAGGKGDRKRPQYESSIERQRRVVSRVAYGALFLGGLGALWYIGEQEGEKKENASLMDRIKRNATELSDYFSKPAFKHLLPDPLPPPHQRPYTLLVDLEDLLVHSEWDRQHGWRTAKRPGVDYFLGYLSQFYEIVLFTSQPVYTAIPIAEKLDPFTLYLPYKLFRDSTRYVDGKVVKDLSYLNRDLSKVVMLDTNPEHSALQPDNAIVIKPWDGARGDKGLVEMIPFLESIGIYAPADVRPVLKHYAGKDIPREYAKKEAEAKAAAVEQWERTHPNAAAGAGSSFLSGIFGGGAASRPSQPMTYLEVKRQQAQQQYEEEQKYYKEHAEEFARLIEEDKARQMAEMKGSLMGMFGGPAPAVKDGEAAPAGQAQQGQQQAQAQQPAAK